MIFSEFSAIANGDIESELYASPNRRTLYIHMGHIATFGGDIQDESPTVIEPDALFVERWMRGYGIGYRLLKTLVVEAKQLGVETIKGHIESQYSLDIVTEIFDSDTTKFFHDDPDRSIEMAPEQYSELPISPSQVRQSLVRAEQFEDDLEYREIGFDFEVDISSIDLASNEWRRPF